MEARARCRLRWHSSPAHASRCLPRAAAAALAHDEHGLAEYGEVWLGSFETNGLFKARFHCRSISQHERPCDQLRPPVQLNTHNCNATLLEPAEVVRVCYDRHSISHDGAN